MALRAVVFDYGMVLTGPPDAEATPPCCASPGCLRSASRASIGPTGHAYDEGKLTGIGFWQKFLREAGLPADQAWPKS